MIKIVKILILTQMEPNPNQMVISRVVSASRGKMAIFEDIFCCHDWRKELRVGSSGLETGESAEHPPMRRTGPLPHLGPRTKNYPLSKCQ